MKTYPYNSPEYDRAYRLAKARVEERAGFFWHLASYLVVNGFLFTIYLITNFQNNEWGYPWFIWPLAGWGIGLILHAFGVFVFPENSAEKERRIEREMERMGVNPPYMPPVTPDEKPVQWVTPPTVAPSNNYQPPTVVNREEALK
jgi:hypothetical protein